MKKYICKGKVIVILFAGLLALSNCTSTKNVGNENRNMTASPVKNMIDSQKFIFIAEMVNPLRGRNRHLTSRYDVAVSHDTLVSYLPYFGRAYTAPLNSSESGIQFTSTDFSYNFTELKPNKWEVLVKPNDVSNGPELRFTIFDNGSASLMVTSNSKDPISFTGHLKQ